MNVVYPVVRIDKKSLEKWWLVTGIYFHFLRDPYSFLALLVCYYVLLSQSSSDHALKFLRQNQRVMSADTKHFFGDERFAM